MVQNLVPHLRHKNGDYIEAYFHKFEVHMSRGVTVDENGKVITALDMDVDNIIDYNEDLHTIFPEPAPTIPTLAPHCLDSSNIQCTESQSLSTLGTLGTDAGNDASLVAGIKISIIPPNNILPTQELLLIIATLLLIQQFNLLQIPYMLCNVPWP